MATTRDHRRKQVETRKLPLELRHQPGSTDFARRMRRRYWTAVAIWTPLIVVMIGASQWLGGMLLMTRIQDYFRFSGSGPAVGTQLLVPIFWFGIFLVISVILPLTIVMISGLRILDPRYRAMIAANGHCAACGYEIMDLPPEPDGCTVCPECGAAWRCHEKSPASA
jgi:hypothetical protein